MLVGFHELLTEPWVEVLDSMPEEKARETWPEEFELYAQLEAELQKGAVDTSNRPPARHYSSIGHCRPRFASPETHLMM